MKGLLPLTSRKSDEWQTPPDVFRPLHAEFNFTLDVCATEDNAQCQNFFSASTGSGLLKSWGSNVCWMNPPYSRVGLWVEKAHEESKKAATVVCLVPSRTDTKWWHAHAIHASEIRWIKGRVGFLSKHHRGRSRSPFPSCVLVFRVYPDPTIKG